jgi:ketosteroid isomerase-like protein
MKRISIAVSVAVLVFAAALSAKTPVQQINVIHVANRVNPVQELTKLENDWNDATVKHDWAVLDQILTGDYTWTDLDGNVWTKPEFLASLKSGESTITSSITDDIKVRVYGDTAVVTGRTTVKEQYKGKDISGQYRWTDMWVKDYRGRWRCVADQGSRIAQK